MKIRNGFVSNSSSSSFLVPRWRDIGDLIRRAEPNDFTEEQEKKLVEFGFKRTINSRPTELLSREEPSKDVFMAYQIEVTVNQDDVARFLLENKIPYISDEHYGDYGVVYIPEQNKVMIGQNIGLQIMKQYFEKPKHSLEILTREEYLERITY